MGGVGAADARPVRADTLSIMRPILAEPAAAVLLFGTGG